MSKLSLAKANHDKRDELASIASQQPSYLNIGCGYHYATAREWTNVDFLQSGPGVIAHNLLQGIPMHDASFDLVYHSHVLEHFSKADGEKLIRECNRVLRPGGILRIAIPDLEQLARNYLGALEKALASPKNEDIADKYDWSVIELLDQGLRNLPGGAMEAWLKRAPLLNEGLLRERLGPAGLEMRDKILQRKEPSIFLKIFKGVTNRLLRYRNKFERVGRYRLGGEPHLWMYDRFSLEKLLTQHGFTEFRICTAYESAIPNWSTYELDTIKGIIRKPDSLFVEAQKTMR